MPTSKCLHPNIVLVDDNLFMCSTCEQIVDPDGVCVHSGELLQLSDGRFKCLNCNQIIWGPEVQYGVVEANIPKCFHNDGFMLRAKVLDKNKTCCYYECNTCALLVTFKDILQLAMKG